MTYRAPVGAKIEHNDDDNLYEFGGGTAQSVDG